MFPDNSDLRYFDFKININESQLNNFLFQFSTQSILVCLNWFKVKFVNNSWTFHYFRMVESEKYSIIRIHSKILYKNVIKLILLSMTIIEFNKYEIQKFSSKTHTLEFSSFKFGYVVFSVEIAKGKKYTWINPSYLTFFK
jgi:hypothetical protein